MLCALLSGCILDNPKFGLDGTSSGTLGGSMSQGVTSSTTSETEASGGSETASGTTTTGEPTTGEPTTGEPTTTTVGTTTDGTSTTTGVMSTTGDDTTDSEGTTGDVLCEVDEIDVFLDTDMDGYGAGAAKSVCPDQVPGGYVPEGGDCNDGDASVNPEATELCDGTDNNCNGLKDEYSEANTSCELVDDLFNKNCSLSSYDDHFYYTCKAKRRPSKAQGICEGFAVADGAKSYHVKIDDSDENASVATLAAEVGRDISIGLRDTVGFDQWEDLKWIEGEAALVFGKDLGAVPWGQGQPDQWLEAWTDMSYQSGLWRDIGDLEFRAFVCEAEPKP